MSLKTEYPNLRNRLASTIDFMFALVASITKLGFDGALTIGRLQDHNEDLAVYEQTPFEKLNVAMFEGDLRIIAKFWMNTRERLVNFLRSSWLVERCEGRLEAIEKSVGDDIARNLRLEIRAYAAAVKVNAPFAYLCHLIIAFDNNITPLERIAVAKMSVTVGKPLPPVPAKRDSKADRSEADRQRRIAMRGSSAGIPLHKRGGKKGNKKSQSQAMA